MAGCTVAGWLVCVVRLLWVFLVVLVAVRLLVVRRVVAALATGAERVPQARPLECSASIRSITPSIFEPAPLTPSG